MKIGKETIRLLKRNKEVKNASWIIIGKVVQMMLAFVVGIWTARYLGPSNYGLIGYVGSYVAFFTAFSTLGMSSSVLINQFTEKPEEEGVTLGSAMGFRMISSMISFAIITGIVYVVDKGDETTIYIAMLSSLALFFQAFDMIEYWFQKRYMSKVSAIAGLFGYIVTAAYKIYLLLSCKSVILFAFASSVDFIAVAVFLYICYKQHNGPPIRFSIMRGKEILDLSYHFIVSGMLVAVYAQTDKIMLKHMLSETDVGFYTTAVSINNTWTFVLSAIVASMAPTIMQLKKDGNEEGYKKKNRQLYGGVFYLSMAVAVMITIFAPLVIRTLYGKAYLGSINPLRTVCWYTAFSYMGVARDAWMICEGKQGYGKWIAGLAAIMNICLNLLLIPPLGATGAAIASLISQILTGFLIPCFMKGLRANVVLMIQAVTLYDYRRNRDDI